MNDKTFDASRYLSRLNGKDYLEVKWRLLWLRTEHPDATVQTELVKHEAGLALFRAQVTLPAGGWATGWGSETASDFVDYIEKAETKALGRALAALGYGTQFCEDFDFAGKASLVDAPVETPATKPHPAGPRTRATGAQINAIYAIARSQHELTEEELNAHCIKAYSCLPAELSRKEASQFIDNLKAKA